MIAESTNGTAPEYLDGPLRQLADLAARKRRAEAEAADLAIRIESLEGRLAKALRRARKCGIESVTFDDRSYRERDGILHSAPCAAAHEVEYDPAGAEAWPAWTDAVVPAPTDDDPAPVPLTYDPIRGAPEYAYDRDGRVIGSRAEAEVEDRAC